MIFYCTTCNHHSSNRPPPPPPPPLANGAGAGQGQASSGTVKPVRYHMWMRHLTSNDHQTRTMAKYGKRYLLGNSRGYKESLLEDCNYVVVGVPKSRMHEFGVWCTEFGMITELLHYPNEDCYVVTIQGVRLGPSGPGVERAESFVEQTSFMGRPIRVYRSINMISNDWTAIKSGYVNRELHRESMRRRKNVQPTTDAGQSKRALKTVASNHHPAARNDKENRADSVDGPNLDQSGRVGKYGDRKANPPRVQVVKGNVAEVVPRMEEPKLEVSVVVIKEKEPVAEHSVSITTGDERGSSVRENQMKSRSGRKARKRYDVANMARNVKSTSPLPSKTGENKNCEVGAEVPQPDETEHSEALVTALEENKLTELGETVKGQSLEPVLLVVGGEAAKVDVVEKEVEAESAKSYGEEAKLNAEEVKPDAEEVMIHAIEEKADIAKMEIPAVAEEAPCEVVKADIGKVEIQAVTEEALCVEEKTDIEKAQVKDAAEEVPREEEKADIKKAEIKDAAEEVPREEEKADIKKAEVKDAAEEVPREEEKAVVEKVVEVNAVTEEVHVDEENANVEKKKTKAWMKMVPSEKDKSDIVVEKAKSEEKKIQGEEEKVIFQDAKVSDEVEKGQGKEDRSDVLEEKAKVEEKKVPGEEEGKVVQDFMGGATADKGVGKEEKTELGEKASAEEKILSAGEEGNADMGEQDYMKYALYWYRF